MESSSEVSPFAQSEPQDENLAVEIINSLLWSNLKENKS